jgi:ABC-type antimicrobial peptide transport system permease subunit
MPRANVIVTATVLFLQRMAATLLSIFGLLGLSLSALGLYGVMAYTVSQRTRELGIRISIEAQRRDVLKLILGQGLILSGIGLTGGLIAALIVTRFSAQFRAAPVRGCFGDQKMEKGIICGRNSAA